MDYSPSTYKVREREEEGMGEEEKGEEEEGVSPRTGQIPTGEGPGSQSTPQYTNYHLRLITMP